MPELTLLCDGSSLAAADHWHNSGVKSSCDSLEQISQSTAASSIEAVVSSVSDSVNSLQIQSSVITQQTARQPSILKKLYQPVRATDSSGEDNMNPCCHRCTNCQAKLSSDEQNRPYADQCGGNGKGPYNVLYAADNFVHSSTPVIVSVQSSVMPDSMQNTISSTDACAHGPRIQNVSVSSAAKVPMHSQSTPPIEPLPDAGLIVQQSVAHDGSRHVVESVHSPTLTMSSYDLPSDSGQPVASGPRQNGHFHHRSLPHGSRFVQASHQHRAPYELQGSGTSCNSISGQQTSQRPATPMRYISPASQLTSHAGVRQICPTHSSHLPLKVKGKSTAYQLNDQCSVPHISPPAAAKVSQLHQQSPTIPDASQCDQLPGISKAVHFISQPGAPLVGLGVQYNVPVCQHGILYDSGRCVSQSSSALVSDSEHSKCQVYMQHLSSHSSTPVPDSGCPKTVDHLLQTIHVQNVDKPKDFATVDDFVESVLVRNSASADSGLQVNDSTGSDGTPPMISSPLVVDNHSNGLHNVGDSVARSDASSSHLSMDVKKRRELSVESDTHEHLGYFQDKTTETETSEQFSSGDNRPKMCSVAVNTTLYWPPVDNGSNRRNVARNDVQPSHNDAHCFNCSDAGCNDSTAQAAIDMAVQRSSGYARDADSPGAGVLQRLHVSDRDTELVNDTYDSMADISLHTPPPPVFPSPSEESVVSEMIMDMPEYTALSQEK